jgi:IS5 family transposase
MKSPGFFDVEECLAGLSKKAILEQLNRTIDFNLFRRPDLERAVPHLAAISLRFLR